MWWSKRGLDSSLRRRCGVAYNRGVCGCVLFVHQATKGADHDHGAYAAAPVNDASVAAAPTGFSDGFDADAYTDFQPAAPAPVQNDAFDGFALVQASDATTVNATPPATKVRGGGGGGGGANLSLGWFRPCTMASFQQNTMASSFSETTRLFI